MAVFSSSALTRGCASSPPSVSSLKDEKHGLVLPSVAARGRGSDGMDTEHVESETSSCDDEAAQSSFLAGEDSSRSTLEWQSPPLMHESWFNFEGVLFDER